MKSINHECVDRLNFVGEASLQKAVREYVFHYNEERNHQGIDNHLINPRRGTVIPVGDPQAVEHHAEIVRTGRLGDMAIYSTGDGIRPQAQSADPEWNKAAEDYFVRWSARPE